jgi:predicted nucleic acid-binding protein
VQQVDWISRCTVTDGTLVSALSVELDPGEAEAISAAIECHAELLLIDEQRGRSVAQRFGLRVIGLLGILIESKHQGLIEAVKPLLDALTTHAGFLGKQRSLHAGLTGSGRGSLVARYSVRVGEIQSVELMLS